VKGIKEEIERSNELLVLVSVIRDVWHTVVTVALLDC
jgi:hypothetical protein